MLIHKVSPLLVELWIGRADSCVGLDLVHVCSVEGLQELDHPLVLPAHPEPDVVVVKVLEDSEGLFEICECWRT